MLYDNLIKIYGHCPFPIQNVTLIDNESFLLYEVCYRVNMKNVECQVWSRVYIKKKQSGKPGNLLLKMSFIYQIS